MKKSCESVRTIKETRRGKPIAVSMIRLLKSQNFKLSAKPLLEIFQEIQLDLKVMLTRPTKLQIVSVHYNGWQCLYSWFMKGLLVEINFCSVTQC